LAESQDRGQQQIDDKRYNRKFNQRLPAAVAAVKPPLPPRATMLRTVPEGEGCGGR
jgi:hypothetical protein